MKYKNMEVENVTKENLLKISETIGVDLLVLQDTICFEYSKYSMNERGEITSVIILREHSLFDYYNGTIPTDTKPNVYDKNYIKNRIKKLSQDGMEQYEIVFCYVKNRNFFVHLHELYHLIVSHDGIKSIGVVWHKYQENEIFPLHSVLFNYNNEVWIGLQIED